MIQLSKDYLMTLDHVLLFTATGYCLQYNMMIFRGMSIIYSKLPLFHLKKYFYENVFKNLYEIFFTLYWY